MHQTRARRILSAAVAALTAATALTVGQASPAAAYVPAYTFVGVADWDRDGHQDVLARDLGGRLWLSPGQAHGGLTPGLRLQLGSGWGTYIFAGIVDWDNDGNQDIVARDGGGRLWWYPGRSQRAHRLVTRVLLGQGWRSYTFAGVADFDRDGHPDVVARDYQGILWLYPGRSQPRIYPADRARIGHGWRTYTFAGVTDWDDDGHRDVLARDEFGRLWLRPGVSVRGYGIDQSVQIGRGWRSYTFAGLADVDEDGHRDLVARDDVGRLWLYPGQSKRGPSTAGRVQLGSGW